MRQISLVGAVDEEVGDYFPEFLDMLEDSPFLKVRENSIQHLNCGSYFHTTDDTNHGSFCIIKILISFELEGRKGRDEKLKVILV